MIRDGLWLNESFASYMAVFALRWGNFIENSKGESKATKWKGERPWQDFNFDMKKWAETEDQLSTTHPIQGVSTFHILNEIPGTVVDTDATFLTFDGITYGKGAAVLKQVIWENYSLIQIVGCSYRRRCSESRIELLF